MAVGFLNYALSFVFTGDRVNSSKRQTGAVRAQEKESQHSNSRDKGMAPNEYQ